MTVKIDTFFLGKTLDKQNAFLGYQKKKKDLRPIFILNLKLF